MNTAILPNPVAAERAVAVGAAKPARLFAATYFDSGFYLISDAAASALSRKGGGSLPRHGYQRSVSLCDAKGVCFAKCWLQRTSDTFRDASPQRGWSWAVFAFKKPDDCLEDVAYGRSFDFTA